MRTVREVRIYSTALVECSLFCMECCRRVNRAARLTVSQLEKSEGRKWNEEVGNERERSYGDSGGEQQLEVGTQSRVREGRSIGRPVG